MTDIQFSNEEKELIVERVKKYFTAELAQDISQFDAEFLIDFFSEQIGNYYYNKGLADAQSLINIKLEDIIYELEKPTEFSR